MLQVSLFLLAWGLCQHMWAINTTVAYTLVALTGLAALLYLIIVISGLSSYACPFQTPVSMALRRPLKELWRITVSLFAQCGHALSWTRRVWNRSLRSFIPRQPPPPTPLDGVQVQRSEPWLKPENLVKMRSENVNDARCVSWIVRNITDPEALDAAIQLAGTVQWFKDGADVEPPYDVIVSNFHGCFDSDGRLYPGSTDRAYYSGRAMLWIQVLAGCKSQEFSRRFPSQLHNYTVPVSDHDSNLAHLLHIRLPLITLPLIRLPLKTRRRPFRRGTYAYPEEISLDSPHRAMESDPDGSFIESEPNGPVIANDPVDHLLGHTPSHSQWFSNLLLHEIWAKTAPHFPMDYGSGGGKVAVSLNIMLNRLLEWCICLGSPIDKDVLRVQDKTYDIPYFHPSSCSFSIPLAIS